MGLNWGTVCYVANREVSRANRHLTDTYMYKAGGVACSYNIDRYPVVLSLACGAQYCPIVEIVQKTCCEAASLGYMGLLTGMWLE